MTAREIARQLGATLTGPQDHEVARAAHPDEATGPEDLAVALSRDLLPNLATTRAGAAIIMDGAEVPAGAPEVLIALAPSRSCLPAASELFRFRPSTAPGVHPSAVVEEGAAIDPSACIGPFCFVASGATIGARTTLVSHCSVLPGAALGPDGLLYSGVRIGPAVRIGARVVIQSNATLGSDGFSFQPVDPGNVEHVKATGKVNPDPEADATLVKVQSLGGVEIAEDVEIGAQTAVDAGTLLPTRIGRGTKIDNLVQVAHNVQIGENCLICGGVGITGSVQVGDDVIVAGGSGVGNNLHPGEIYSGLPAIPHRQTIRNIQTLKRLDRHASKVFNPARS